MAQPQQLPPQQPPLDAIGPGVVVEPLPSLPPPAAATFSSRTVSWCPLGHEAASLDWLMGRLMTNVSPHCRQRNS